MLPLISMAKAKKMLKVMKKTKKKSAKWVLMLMGMKKTKKKLTAKKKRPAKWPKPFAKNRQQKCPVYYGAFFHKASKSAKQEYLRQHSHRNANGVGSMSLSIPE